MHMRPSVQVGARGAVGSYFMYLADNWIHAGPKMLPDGAALAPAPPVPELARVSRVAVTDSCGVCPRSRSFVRLAAAAVGRGRAAVAQADGHVGAR
jgi:hypothetical protein